jgi:hypothetical protein
MHRTHCFTRRLSVFLALVTALSVPQSVRSQDEAARTISFLPAGLLYESHIGAEKEPRLGGAILFRSGPSTYVDANLGGRVGLVRFGTARTDEAQGWQLDVEAAAFPRLNLAVIRSSFEAADFRFGFPLTMRRGPVSAKFGYYHISSHVGDEYLERNPRFVRVNYVRDALLFGITHRVRPDLSTYLEAAYAVYVSGGAEPWELEFGAEYEPKFAACSCGRPFVVINGHLREEFDFGGSVNVIAGWLWNGDADHQLRLGAQYFRGRSRQYAFLAEREELIGIVVWLDG